MMAHASNTGISARLEESLEPLIEQVVASCELAGLAIGIVREDEVVYAKGFGVRSIATREPVTAQSLFHLASVSKPFVATAVMQLVEQGKVELEAPVVSYLPYFTMRDERHRAMTVQQMLSHVAGMPDELDYHWDQPEDDDGALERYVRSLASASLLFAPGKRFAYSNIAYEVLGDLIAKVSGQPFETYMRVHLLHPLGMSTSTFLKQDVPAELATAPHVRVPRLMLSPIYPYHRAHAPSSTLHSSALEMCLWARANLQRGSLDGKHILSAGSYDLLWHPYARVGDDDPPEDIGLSWFLGAYRGQRRISHGGSDTGFQSSFGLLPDSGLGVVVLANALPAPVYEIRQAALDILLGETPTAPRPPVLVPLADILSGQGVEAALGVYHALRERQPTVYDFGAQQCFAAGDALIGIGRSSEAVRVLRLGLAIAPASCEGYSLLAFAYHHSGQDALARTTISQALQQDPHDAIALAIHRQLTATGGP